MHAAALHFLGLTGEDRVGVVEGMFLEDRRDAVAYWILLLTSTGIATLGLALGSSAVVIGAMLIAPLMGPIVELGMALVLGSAALTVRSLARLAGSLVGVVGGAAVLTAALPFHVVTPEVASRTQPTALDLLVAVFVAIAAAFTTVRRSSDTMSAAAGAAIGIALVPPLCASGFGLGIGDLAVAGGAALLFLTNLSAILVVSVLAFWVLGFERVNAADWETAALEEARPGGLVHRAMQGVQRLFRLRFGRLLRAVIPLALLGLLLLPLTRALRQVAWEVRARGSVSHILNDALSHRAAVQTLVSVKGRAISVQLYVVGTPEEARAIEDTLQSAIAADTHSDPTVQVVAVPDMRLLREARTPDVQPPQPPSGAQLREDVAASLTSAWPRAAGAIQGWSLQLRDSAAASLTIHYWGAPFDPVAAEAIGSALSARLAWPVTISTVALPPAAATAAPDSGTVWLPQFLRMDSLAAATSGTFLCVAIPHLSSRARRRVAAAVSNTTGPAEASRIRVDSGAPRWSARLSPAPCPAAVAPPAAPTP